MTLSPFSSCTKRERTQLIVGLVVSSILGVLNVSWLLRIVSSVIAYISTHPLVGKELSSNDFTDELKAKLEGIEEFANRITNVSQLVNDSKFQTEEGRRSGHPRPTDGRRLKIGS